MKTKKQKKIDPRIIEHFSSMGKKSWEKRKEAILKNGQKI